MCTVDAYETVEKRYSKGVWLSYDYLKKKTAIGCQITKIRHRIYRFLLNNMIFQLQAMSYCK